MPLCLGITANIRSIARIFSSLVAASRNHLSALKYSGVRLAGNFTQILNSNIEIRNNNEIQISNVQKNVTHSYVVLTQRCSLVRWPPVSVPFAQVQAWDQHSYPPV